MSAIIQQVINHAENNKVGFINIINYTNQQGETSDYLCNIGFKYSNLKARDLSKLENANKKELNKKGIEKGFTPELIIQGLEELKQSIVSPNTNRSQAQTNAYVPLNNQKNVKFCLANASIKLTAIVVRKTVKVQGVYKTVNSKPITICKKWLSTETKQSSAKIRYFDIDANKLQAVKIDGVTITLQF